MSTDSSCNFHCNMNFIRSVLYVTAQSIQKILLTIIVRFSFHLFFPSLLLPPLCHPSLPLSLLPFPPLSHSFPLGFGEGDRATRDEREEREAYRTRGGPDYNEKKADTGAGADFKPEFRGGFGRGRGFGAPGGGRFGQ